MIMVAITSQSTAGYTNLLLGTANFSDEANAVAWINYHARKWVDSYKERQPDFIAYTPDGDTEFVCLTEELKLFGNGTEEIFAAFVDGVALKELHHTAAQALYEAQQ